MTYHGPGEEQGPGDGSGQPREPRDPVDTLRIAMIVYIAVNLVYGVPLTFFPGSFLDVIGVEEASASELGGLRWMGAMLLAWGISGILVLARPFGRAYFVTAGALQLSFAAAAVVYSWLVGDGLGEVWFDTLTAVIFVGSAIYLSWARLKARAVLAQDPRT